MARANPSALSVQSTATIGFEAKLWLTMEVVMRDFELPAGLVRANWGLFDSKRCRGEEAAIIQGAQAEEAMNRHPITPGSIRHSTFGFRHSPLLALRGIEADLGPPAGAGPNTFRRELHPDPARRVADTATHVSANPQPPSHSAGLLRSERQLLANPPFNFLN
jgi:hypothetical protein